MLNTGLNYLFYVSVGTLFFSSLFSLLGANLADLREAKLAREQKLHPNARHRRRRPLVSVIVFAQNDSETIEQCLSGLLRSNYKKLQLIVVDNASSDATVKIVKAFKPEHKKLDMRVVAKRKVAERSAIIATAKRYVKGELVVALDASSIPDDWFIRAIVDRYVEGDVSAVIANTRVGHGYNLLGITDMFTAMSANWQKKAGMNINSETDVTNYAAAYSKDTFTKLTKPKNCPALDNLNLLRKFTESHVFAEKAIVSRDRVDGNNTNPLRNIRGAQYMLTLLRMLEPVLAAFMLYIALRYENPVYFFVGWLGFTSIVVLAIWSDGSRALAEKLRLSLLAPVAYAVHILNGLVRIIRLLPYPSYRGAAYSGKYRYRLS